MDLVSNNCTKATWTLGGMSTGCYRVNKQGNVVGPQSILLRGQLENVLNRAARYVTGNYTYETESMTGIQKEIKLEWQKKRRKDSRLIMLFKGLKGAVSILTNDLVSPPPTLTTGLPDIIIPWHFKPSYNDCMYN